MGSQSGKSEYPSKSHSRQVRVSHFVKCACRVRQVCHVATGTSETRTEEGRDNGTLERTRLRGTLETESLVNFIYKAVRSLSGSLGSANGSLLIEIHFFLELGYALLAEHDQ
jgi:hypothetical protein